MKVSILGLVISITLVAVASSDSVTKKRINDNSAVQIACNWYPLCGDPDIYSPLTEPKDSKSKTDSKDNKNDKDAKLA